MAITGPAAGRKFAARAGILLLGMFLGSVLFAVFTGCAGLEPSPGTNGSGAFATGQYRNLFAEAGHSSAAISNKISAAFQQLFHGDPATQAVYYPAGTNANGPLAYIYDAGDRDVRSEGMSYGMMIAVQLNHQAEFNAIWNWARTWMYHASPAHPAAGFFSWSMKTNGTPNDEMPAPDGEEYFVTALYFAAGRWGNGSGIYDYRAEADRLLAGMRHRTLITGPTVGGPMMAGALFEPEFKMVRFTPDTNNWDHTDPSYHLPAFYELWARWGPAEDRAFWAEAAAASRNFFPRTAHPVTGLAPDYANFDGTPWAAPWNTNSAHFQYDSWRTAMNWSVDWAWWAKDARETELSDRVQAFFESQGLSAYGNRFTLGGHQLGHEHATGLVAMNAVDGLAATHPRSRQFVEALWNTPVPAGQWRYYDGMLYLLGLLHCSGEFRIWAPQQPSPSTSERSLILPPRSAAVSRRAGPTAAAGLLQAAGLSLMQQGAFNVLRLVLCTQPRSEPIAFGDSARTRPEI